MDTDISIDGRRMRCEIRGEGSPVLFVHGFPLSGRLWDGVVSRLQDRYRCIVPDLRGHGGSEASPSATMGDYADDLARLLDGIDEVRPVVLVGMSMGGYVTFEFCRRHPDRVAALALTNTRAGADSAEAARGRKETARKVLEEGSALVADAMVEKLFAPGVSRAMTEEWRGVMAATPPAGVAAALAAMAARPESYDTLAGLRRPVLIVAGAEDAIVPVEEAERMCAAARDARLLILPGTGHMTPVERPVELSAALGIFLAEVSRR
jgi:pimeloyl-ACP methyl ester carboxylesterase